MNMTKKALLGRYEEMRYVSQTMLEAAKKGDWERLIKVEKTRSAIEEYLRREDQTQWAGKDAENKAALIRAILDADAQTSQLTRQRMSEMQNLLGNISAGKKMKKAYEHP
ncbi:MAG TPA: flagellar protein FliT [Noviherbaspirillum sp.]|nr:flagellar protein FliT [Noviherbaspirillum sp.]